MKSGLSISGRIGRGAITHNNRNFIAKNVDSTRTANNIVFVRKSLPKLYHKLFDAALKEYNATKTKTRDKIPDYYEHIRTGKQEKLFQETIFQVGNKDTAGVGTPGGDAAVEVLKNFMSSFQQRNPHLRVFNAVLHLDEATPHLHVDFVPVATEQKRGLKTRVSMKQALAQQGFVGTAKKHTEQHIWIESEKAKLSELLRARGIEPEIMEDHHKHLDVETFKAQKQVEAAQQKAQQSVAKLDAIDRQLAVEEKTYQDVRQLEEMGKHGASGRWTYSEDERRELLALAREGSVSRVTAGRLRQQIAALQTELQATRQKLAQLTEKVRPFLVALRQQPQRTRQMLAELLQPKLPQEHKQEKTQER